MKVYPFHITKQPEQNLLLQHDKGIAFYDKLHQHEEIQLSFVVKGNGTLIVGNSVHTYQAEDIIGIGGQLPHVFKSSVSAGESEMISMFFTRDAFGGSFFEQREMKIIYPLFSLLSYGFKLPTGQTPLRAMFLKLNDTDTFSFFIQFLEILRAISQEKKQQLNTLANNQQLTYKQGDRLQLAIDFVLQHYHEDIELKKVANRMHMSVSAFCRFFKQRTNKTFFQFVNEVRVAQACQYMARHPELSVSEVAIKSGYQSISNFNKYFLKHKGIPPTGFKKKFL
ncbi:DNA-binding domain-containing protein, AraC-type [Croceitalea dokdonensis DOKDO 023]|uniref:DNA-binding domain-containing protein, AraC-type n=1 Tax=Croceitalea dokdonensis DOKDO 023 TaxID=1300341 RepID=A0A0P7AMS2_9FLAO|nr:AraC family transcriptional regulator [Croceitalea dokdonensis]KPM33203.1 DNA-binding domain-containing protein, AraC-type [Croceitalea dokdonensis DOKDO 023]